jgi:hypothetical protein
VIAIDEERKRNSERAEKDWEKKARQQWRCVKRRKMKRMRNLTPSYDVGVY